MSTQQHGGSGPTGPEIPEPTLAERARTLASLGHIGALSTHSRRVPGFPFGSMMPYAIDEAGRPVFFVSGMAMHTQNLQADARASLLIMPADVAGDPLGAARLTLVGPAAQAPPVEVRDLYLSRHQNARQWQDYADFSFYRLEVTAAYFIGGFGVMGWIPAAEYASAAPDPLAEVASGIIEHMNADHSGALRLIVRRFAGEEAEEATMTAVDRLGFHVRLQSGGRFFGRRVAFPREVRDSEQARSVLIEMVRQARGAT